MEADGAGQRAADRGRARGESERGQRKGRRPPSSLHPCARAPRRAEKAEKAEKEREEMSDLCVAVGWLADYPAWC